MSSRAGHRNKAMGFFAFIHLFIYFFSSLKVKDMKKKLKRKFHLCISLPLLSAC